MDDLRAALGKSDVHLTMIGTLYEADLELQRTSPTLRAKIRAFLDSEKAALDEVAARAVATAGSGEVDVHYPLAPDAETFDAFLDRFMPGVREGQPNIAGIVARHQPYGVPALSRLRDLLVEPARQELTPETRPAPPEPEAPAPPPEAAPAEPAPERSPRPPTGLGGGLAGSVFVNGIEYDPITLKPLTALPEVRRETIYVDWQFGFEGGDASARQTLEAIHVAVTAAVDDVAAAAGL